MMLIQFNNYRFVRDAAEAGSALPRLATLTHDASVVSSRRALAERCVH
jgi:hypothetical protein